MAALALAFELAVGLNDVSRRNELFKQALRTRILDGAEQKNNRRQEKGKSEQHQRLARSIAMDSHDVDHHGRNQQNEERHMQMMPHAEQPLEEGEPLRPLRHHEERPKPRFDVSHLLPALPPRRPLPRRETHPNFAPAAAVGRPRPNASSDGGEAAAEDRRRCVGGLARIFLEIGPQVSLLTRELRQVVIDRREIGNDIPQRDLLSIETLVYFRIEVSTDDPTRHHDKHCEECKPAVERPQLEVGMKDDENRPDNPHDHVKTEPVRDPPESVQNPKPLPQGIREQHQHDERARDAEPIARAAFGYQMPFIALHPREDQDGARPQSEQDGPELQE